MKKLLMKLPEFPRSRHLPYKANASADDIIAIESDAEVVFESSVSVEEKVDGASIGITIHEDHFLVRNRNHIMNKGFVKNTPAKKQFTSVWNWTVDNRSKFDKIMEQGQYSVYGEWMVGRHGMAYTRLPDWFVAYDVYDQERQHFLGYDVARPLLIECGFCVPPEIYVAGNRLANSGEFHVLMTECFSEWADGKVEGIYIRVGAEIITHRFKMVRSDFERNVPQFGEDGKIIKNQVA